VSKTDEAESVTDWIPVLSPYASPDAGLSALPDVDDQVLVMSLDSMNKRLVALGSLWSTGAKPPETGENGDADLNGDGKNALHFIKSRAGSMIVFDDTEGAEKIQIISSDNKARLEFSVADKLTLLKTENDISISAKGAITIAAEEISITSKKKLNVSGDETQIIGKKKMEVTASQDLTLKGSGVALN
jgi:phage baseplate assembly protein gpV